MCIFLVFLSHVWVVWPVAHHQDCRSSRWMEAEQDLWWYVRKLRTYSKKISYQPAFYQLSSLFSFVLHSCWLSWRQWVPKRMSCSTYTERQNFSRKMKYLNFYRAFSFVSATSKSKDKLKKNWNIKSKNAIKNFESKNLQLEDLNSVFFLPLSLFLFVARNLSSNLKKYITWSIWIQQSAYTCCTTGIPY